MDLHPHTPALGERWWLHPRRQGRPKGRRWQQRQLLPPDLRTATARDGAITTAHSKVVTPRVVKEAPKAERLARRIAKAA